MSVGARFDGEHRIRRRRQSGRCRADLPDLRKRRPVACRSTGSEEEKAGRDKFSHWIRRYGRTQRRSADVDGFLRSGSPGKMIQFSSGGGFDWDSRTVMMDGSNRLIDGCRAATTDGWSGRSVSTVRWIRSIVGRSSVDDVSGQQWPNVLGKMEHRNWCSDNVQKTDPNWAPSAIMWVIGYLSDLSDTHAMLMPTCMIRESLVQFGS
ncbi:hypothetical protein ACLOJK_027397 [Asimina triloba]